MTIVLVGGSGDARTLEVSKDVGVVDVPLNTRDANGIMEYQRYRRTEHVKDGAIVFEPE